MAYQARIPDNQHPRQSVDEARMARVQLVSRRLQSIIGSSNNTNPYDPPPYLIDTAITANERTSFPDVTRIGSATSDKTLGISKPREKLSHELDEKNKDDAAVRSRTPSLNQIGVAVTTSGPVASYLPAPASSITRIPIERELYDRLNIYSQTGSATRTDLVNLSIHDLTPERHTGLHRNVLLLHAEAGEGRSLAVCEVMIPAAAKISEGKSGKWIYFTIEPEGEMWTMFACPIEAVDKPYEGKETVVKEGVRKIYNRVELDMCRGGIPLFDGFDVPTSPWLNVVKAMGRGKCRVRYLHEQKNASSRIGKSQR